MNYVPHIRTLRVGTGAQWNRRKEDTKAIFKKHRMRWAWRAGCVYLTTHMYDHEWVKCRWILYAVSDWKILLQSLLFWSILSSSWTSQSPQSITLSPLLWTSLRNAIFTAGTMRKVFKTKALSSLTKSLTRCIRSLQCLLGCVRGEGV